MTAVPDYVPMLIKGKGAKPEDGGCLVQIANWLADPTTWTDEPLCVDDTLARWAIYVNDVADQHHRRQLALLAPRLAGTKLDPKAEEAVKLLLHKRRDENPIPRAAMTGAIVWKKSAKVDNFTVEGLIDLRQLVAAQQDSLYGWLEDMIDYFDSLVGRAAPELLTEQQWLEIKELVGQ